MRELKILHIDDDLECNFLLTEALRRNRHITVVWVSNKTQTENAFERGSYDLIIYGGFMPLKSDLAGEVIKWNNDRGVVILYGTKIDRLVNQFEERSYRIFSKSSEGTHNLIAYIKEGAIRV